MKLWCNLRPFGIGLVMGTAWWCSLAQAQNSPSVEARASTSAEKLQWSDPSLGVPFSERELQWGKSTSQDECAQQQHAVWVTHKLGTECIRYYPSAALDAALEGAAPRPRVAVIFFHGDHLAGNTPLGNYGKITPQSLLDTAQNSERAYKVPYVIVARPGVYGSSGSHRERRRLKEFVSLNAAVDAIKQHYGLEQVVLAGQSSGSTAAAAILTMGRTDVKCAAMGSGGYAVNALAEVKRLKMGQNSRRGCDVTGYCDAYDVIEHVDGIATDPKRPIYIIGDPQDQNTVFELQRAFYDKVEQAGHDVKLMEVEGRGPERHGTAYVTYRVAGLCARSLPVTAGSGQGTVK